MVFICISRMKGARRAKISMITVTLTLQFWGWLVPNIGDVVWCGSLVTWPRKGRHHASALWSLLVQVARFCSHKLSSFCFLFWAVASGGCRALTISCGGPQSWPSGCPDVKLEIRNAKDFFHCQQSRFNFISSFCPYICKINCKCFHLYFPRLRIHTGFFS